MTFEHVIPHVYNKYKTGGEVKRKKFDDGGHATNAVSDSVKFGLLGGLFGGKWAGLAGATIGGLGGGFRQTEKEKEEAQRKANFLAAQNSAAENADPVQLGASRGTAHAIDNSTPYAQGAAQDRAPQASAMTNPVPNIQSYKTPAVMKRGGKIKSSRDILKELLNRKS